MAERQSSLSQTHDHPVGPVPRPRGRGKDGPPTEGVQRGEDARSVPGQTQGLAMQERRGATQPQTFHRLYF